MQGQAVSKTREAHCARENKRLYQTLRLAAHTDSPLAGTEPSGGQTGSEVKHRRNTGQCQREQLCPSSLRLQVQVHCNYSRQGDLVFVRVRSFSMNSLSGQRMRERRKLINRFNPFSGRSMKYSLVPVFLLRGFSTSGSFVG